MLRLLFALLLIALLVSCTSQPAQTPQAESNAALAGNMGGPASGLPVTALPAFPADTEVQRETSAGGSIKRLGDQYEDKSINAQYQIGDGYMLLESQAGNSSWASYSFDTGPVADHSMIVVRHEFLTAGTLYLLIANYQSMRWEVHPLGLGEFDSFPFVLLENDGRHISPAGNVHIACLAWDGFSVGIYEVELFTVANPPIPPLELTATEGSWYHAIFLGWPSVDNALEYEIDYRAMSGEPSDWQLLDIHVPQPFEKQFYTHEDDSPAGKEADLDRVYLYRVRAVFNGGGKSATWSNVASGYRAIRPPVLGLVSYKQPVDGIVIDWPPESGALSYDLLRDGELLQQEIVDTFYYDQSAVAYDGEDHEYALRTNYPEGTSEACSPRTGSALLWDISHVLDEAAPLRYQLTLEIVDGDRPFSAFIDDQGRVGCSWATTSYPAGPADWQHGIISEAPASELDTHYSLSVCEVDGTPLVFWCRGLDETQLLCARPLSAGALQPEDWAVHEVFADNPHWIGMQDSYLVDGKPAVVVQASLSEGDPNSSYMLFAQVQFPSSGEWDAVAATGGGEMAMPALLEVAGKPCFVSESDSLRFNYSSTSQPAGPADFLSTYIGDQSLIGPQSGTGFSISVVNSVPAIAFRQDEALYYAYAGEHLPDEETDWKLLLIDTGFSGGYEASIENYNNQALICSYSPEADALILSGARSSYPFSSTYSWLNLFPEPAAIRHGQSSAMTLQDNRPVILYSVEEDTPGEMKYMRGY